MVWVSSSLHHKLWLWDPLGPQLEHLHVPFPPKLCFGNPCVIFPYPYANHGAGIFTYKTEVIFAGKCWFAYSSTTEYMGIVIYIRTMIIHGDLITIIWIKKYFAMVYMYTIVHYYSHGKIRCSNDHLGLGAMTRWTPPGVRSP
jgi:hypothetical protein